MQNTFKNYTLTEIKRQDEAFAGVRDRIDSYLKTISGVFKESPDLIIFTGCGTSYHLASSACNYFIMHNSIPAIFLPCFELYLHTGSYIKGQKVLIIPFTRCSTTTEVKMTINKCRTYKNVRTLAITCDEGSNEYNDGYLLSPNSDENSIVMTSSFSSMLYISMIMSLAVAGLYDKINALKSIPDKATQIIQKVEGKITEIAEIHKNKNLFVCLGQGPYFGIAGENSIKLKEMVLLPTEVYYTLEYRHGPISIADENTFFIFYSSNKSEPYDEILIQEIKALGSTVMTVGESLSERIKSESDYFFELGNGNNDFALLPLAIIPGQFLGAYSSLKRGLNPDVPRNLSKAVII